MHLSEGRGSVKVFLHIQHYSEWCLFLRTGIWSSFFFKKEHKHFSPKSLFLGSTQSCSPSATFGIRSFQTCKGRARREQNQAKHVVCIKSYFQLHKNHTKEPHIKIKYQLRKPSIGSRAAPRTKTLFCEPRISPRWLLPNDYQPHLICDLSLYGVITALTKSFTLHSIRWWNPRATNSLSTYSVLPLQSHKLLKKTQTNHKQTQTTTSIIRNILPFPGVKAIGKPAQDQ